MSIGGCETGWLTATTDSIIGVGVSQGQTFFVSTGDTGSTAYGCTTTSVEYPASSKYAIAVGGTTLYTNGTTYVSETAWSGSGGGISKLESIQTWQSSIPLLAGKGARGTPDFSFDADPSSGALIIVNGKQAGWGGTSLAAPLFTATWARMLSSCYLTAQAGQILYGVRQSYPTYFRDITSGSNGAYSAGT